MDPQLDNPWDPQLGGPSAPRLDSPLDPQLDGPLDNNIAEYFTIWSIFFFNNFLGTDTYFITCSPFLKETQVQMKNSKFEMLSK